MVHRTLMVLKMKGNNSDAIAEAFAAHDKTDLPLTLGACTRTLFQFNDLYIHLVESNHAELVQKLYKSHQDPIFSEINSAIGKLVTPYSPNWRELKDNVAAEFYHHRFE
jgi:hypothetical protein